MDEEKWRETVADEEGEREGEGELIVRRRGSAKVVVFGLGDESNVKGDGGAAEENEHGRSVYLDDDEGSTHASDYVLEKNCKNGFGETTGIKVHLNGAIEGNQIEEHTTVTPQSEIEVLTSLISDSEAFQTTDSEAFQPSEKKVPTHKFQGEPQPNSRWVLAEIDVEKVLDEQDTHDLYCPNCNSCITKRVILRKRKRKVREILFDAKRERIEPLGTATLTTTEDDESMAKRPEEGPFIFKCLSCFSCFIPLAGGGFRLLEGFWRRVFMNENIQSLQPLSSESLGHQTYLSIPETLEKQGEGKSTTDEVEDKFPKHTLKKSDYKRDDIISPILGPQQTENIENLKVDEFHPVIEVDATEEDGGKYFPGEISRNELEHDEARTVDLKSPFPYGPTVNGKEVATVDLKHPVPYDLAVPTVNGKGEATDLLLEDLLKPESQVAQPVEPQYNLELPVSVPQISVHVVDMPHGRSQAHERSDWEVLKAVVYGGLLESITSLGVITSASGANASTLKIIAMGLANLIGGLFIVSHNLWELRREEQDDTGARNEETTSYWKSLGKRGHFGLHATAALLSYIIFGLLPPVIYGFSFRASDNKEYKLMTVAVASLACIAILSLAKAHVQRVPKPYLKCLFTYVLLGMSVSGLAYVVGVFIEKFLRSFPGFDDHDGPLTSPPSMGFLQQNTGKPLWLSVG